MRPLRLQLEGFTCFRDRQDPLELDGLDLFAISGPTGAGKSSLLDAMIFALFGRVPRMGKVGLGELISLGRDKMTVVLDFRLGDTTYRVARTGHRSRASQAVLAELRGELEQPLGEGVKAVDEEVKRLLGFDYDTFTRAVILPQGEFAAFLKGRPGEQQKILRDLLRLHVFETMRRLAGEEWRKLETMADSDRRRIEEDFADATPAELARRRGEAEALDKRLAVTEESLRGLRRTVEERRRELARVRGLLEPRDKARRRAQELGTRRDAETARRTELGVRRQRLAAAGDKLAGDLSRARSELEAVGYDPELDVRLDRVREAASSLADRRRALGRHSAGVAELAAEGRKLQAEAEKHTAAEARAEERLRTAEARRREREATLRDAEHRNHVGLLRRELAPGEACPVCEQAVAEPPSVPELPELDDLGEELRAARRTEDAARRELDAARGATASVRARIESLLQQIEAANLRTAELESKIAEEEKALEEAVGDKIAGDRGETVEARVLAAVARVGKQRSEHAAAEARRGRLERQAADAEQQRQHLEDEIGKLEVRLAELVREVAEAEKEAHDYDRRIREIGAAEGFEDEEKELAALDTRAGEERQRLGALRGALDDLGKRIARRAELEKEIEGRHASRQRMRQLSQDLRSDRFEAYLLEKTFRELVAGASLRLMDLSQRYTLDFGRGGFQVLDHDNAGQPRSADTLSGGETFLASVSLALELSEQIQREAGAVSLDSIFIDEGFGSLDPETLEIVAEAIESLPTGGRMVGIITHIPELTRRLPHRIWVEKAPNGSRYRVEEG
jgi:exonuclease SbcC